MTPFSLPNTQFRCSYCSLVRSSSNIPPFCPTKDSCDFFAIDAVETDAPSVSPSLLAEFPASTDPVPCLSYPSQREESIRQIVHADTAQHENRSSESRPNPIQEPTVAPLTLNIAGLAIPVLREVVLGRNGDLALEAFRGVREVSRRHCQLTPDAGRWWLTHLSENSPSTLNGSGLAFQQRRQLRVGLNEVVLGEVLTFTLTVGSASEMEVVEEDGYPDPFAGSQRRRVARVAQPTSSGQGKREDTQ
jgi:hypothetical protein